ncbi:MAG: hypothetical protein IJ661_11970 [Lachnospiraceae bacterium]|nr:hypothetical protein [Lachnospiraceae bacterium]
MEDMNLFGKSNIHSDLLGNVEFIDRIGASSSDGDLIKWIVKKGEVTYYLKGCSKFLDGEELYECESECVACRLAKILGLSNIVEYDMDVLTIGTTKYKVCVSKNFIGEYNFNTYVELLPDISKYYGKEKYELVVGYNNFLQSQINNILLFDAIIYNDDRHLNNLAIINTGKNQYIPLFDNGASLFGKIPSKGLKFTNRTSFAYQNCKPFYNTVGEQLTLVNECNLNSISKEEIGRIVYRYFEKNRARSVIKLLYNNLKEVGDRYGKQLLY